MERGCVPPASAPDIADVRIGANLSAPYSVQPIRDRHLQVLDLIEEQSIAGADPDPHPIRRQLGSDSEYTRNDPVGQVQR